MDHPREKMYLLFTGDDARTVRVQEFLRDDPRACGSGGAVGMVVVEAGIFGGGHYVVARHRDGEPPFLLEVVVHRDTPRPQGTQPLVYLFDRRRSKTEQGATMSADFEGHSLAADAWIYPPTVNRQRYFPEISGRDGMRLVAPWSGSPEPRVALAVGWHRGHLIIKSLHEGYDQKKRVVPLVTHTRVKIGGTARHGGVIDGFQLQLFDTKKPRKGGV